MMRCFKIIFTFFVFVFLVGCESTLEESTTYNSSSTVFNNYNLAINQLKPVLIYKGSSEKLSSFLKNLDASSENLALFRDTINQFDYNNHKSGKFSFNNCSISSVSIGVLSLNKQIVELKNCIYSSCSNLDESYNNLKIKTGRLSDRVVPCMIEIDQQL